MENGAAVRDMQVALGSVLEDAPDATVVVDGKGRIVFVNRPAVKLFGYERDELEGQLLEILVPVGSRDRHSGLQVDYLEQPRPRAAGELNHLAARRRDGSEIPVDVTLSPLRTETDSVLVVAVVHDLSELKRRIDELESSRERFRLLFDDAPVGMALVDLSAAPPRWAGVNKALAEMLGYTREELLAITPGAVVRADVRDDRWSPGRGAWPPSDGRDLVEAELCFRHSSGGDLWAHVSAAVIESDELGSPHLVISHFVDVTDRRVAEAHLQHQALHDLVTGLPNRALLMDRMDHALAQLSRSHRALAVLFVDLDRFKTINDSFGHAVGDRFLMEVASRLNSILRPPDTIARIGGDEFVVLCTGIHSLSDAEVVAARVIRTLSEPYDLNGQELVVSASIGIAMAHSAGDDPHELLRNADVAMFGAKKHGRSQYQVFTEALRSDALDRLHLETDLRHAVEHHNLRLLYQPLVDLHTGAVAGVEALMRFDHPTRGLLLPVEFIPLAEESGLIVDLGRWALTEACKLQARSIGEGSEPLDVAVNLSARQLDDPELLDTVVSTLAGTGADPEHLSFEVTETAYMGVVRSVHGVIDALSTLGIRIAIDDFGTGYSSLVYLKRFPVHAIKVDQSFVAGLGRNADDTAIVAAIISLAHSLKLTAIAEGVETAAQHDQLRALGCDLAQGYHYAPALTAEDLADYLHPAG